jgi:hypothetical protein
MSFLIDKDESDANRRRVPFRLFLSNGTAPDTNASDGTMLGSVNGAAQISLGSISVVSANAGQYYFGLSQSNVSVLGSIALYTDTIATDFPQHVATVQVINSNIMSTQSNSLVTAIAAGTYSGVTIQGLSRINSSVTIADGTYSAVSVRHQAGDYGSITTFGVSKIAAASYSGVTIQGVSNVSASADIISDITTGVWYAGTRSGVTIQGISNYANISNVTLHAGTHSNVTIQGISNYRNISNVTLHAGTHSDVTIQGITRVNSNVSVAPGSVVSADVKQINAVTVIGAGTSGDKWRA